MKRKRRWFRRIVLCVLALVLLAAVAVQVVLWTDLPRQIVVSQLKQATGLDVQIDEFSTGWTGRTKVTGLRLRLPDHDEPFLTVDSARIDHTGLLLLALTQSISIDDIHLDGIRLVAAQNSLHDWNIEEVVRLVSGPDNDQSGGSSANPLANVQRVELTRMQVHVTDAGGKTSNIQDIQLSARSLGPAALRFQVHVNEQEAGSGRLVMRGGWSHQLSLDLQQVVQWAGDWRNELPTPINGNALWQGSLAGGTLQGRLQLDRVDIGRHHIVGLVEVHTRTDESLVLKPLGVRVALDSDGKEVVAMEGGFIEWKDGILSCKGLGVSGYDATAVVSANYDLEGEEGFFSADWSGRQEADIAHRGSLTGTLKRTFHGLRAELSLDGAAATEGLAWDGRMSVSAAGNSWNDLAWELHATDGQVTVASSDTNELPRRIPLTGLVVKGRVDWPTIHVDESEHDFDGQFAAQGWFDAESRQWHLNLQGDAIDPFQVIGQAMDVRLVLDGKPDLIHVTSAKVNGPQVRAEANGQYRLQGDDRGLTLTIAATAWHGLTEEGVAADESQSDPIAGEVEDNDDESTLLPETGRPESNEDVAPTLAGHIRFNGLLKGSPDAMTIDLRGRIDADRLRVHDRQLDLVTLEVRSMLKDGVLTLDSEPFKVLDGTVRVAGQWKLGDRNLHVSAAMEEILLGRWMPLLAPDLSLSGLGKLDLQASIPLDDINRAVVEGSFSVDNFEFEETRFERMTGKLRTRRRGLLELNPVRVQQAGGTMNGRLVLSVIDGYQARGTLKCQQWVVAVPNQDASARLNGRIDLERADLLASTSRGTFEIDAQMLALEDDLGTAKLQGMWDREKLHVKMHKSSILGGVAQGEIAVQVGDWMQSKGELTWSGIAPARLKGWAAAAGDFDGATRGSLKFGPSENPKAHEPMQFDLLIEAEEKLVYRHLEWGPVKATVYGGQRRWVMDELDLKVADGSVRLWAAVTKHDDQWRDHVHIDVNTLDLNKLVLAADGGLTGLADANDQVPGRLSATLDFYGAIGDWPGHTGGGRIRLAKSNLQNTDIFGAILGTIGIKQSEPTGSGFVDLRLERGGIKVDRFVYRNGSTEVLLTGRITDLRKGTDTSIRGEALASLRPLRDLKLDVLDDVDRLLRAFQSNATAFTIEGTLTDAKVSQSRIADIEGWIDRFLGRQ